MASGIDDEVTLRANREGFLKFQLRPRRLVDVSKVDMSVDILGVKYRTPDRARADRRPARATTPTARSPSPRPPRPATTCRSCRPGTDLVEDVTAARGAPIWFQLYATNKWEVAEHLVKRAEKAGCPVVAVTVDRSGGRNQETLFRLRPSDTRDCSGCHDRSSLAADQQAASRCTRASTSPGCATPSRRP